MAAKHSTVGGADRRPWRPWWRREWLYGVMTSRVLDKASGYVWPRWIFLRALGLIFFSAFYSLAFQIHGLIGERGILPAQSYLGEVGRILPGISRLWYIPSLLWIGA